MYRSRGTGGSGAQHARHVAWDGERPLLFGRVLLSVVHTFTTAPRSREAYRPTFHHVARHACMCVRLGEKRQEMRNTHSHTHTHTQRELDYREKGEKLKIHFKVPSIAQGHLVTNHTFIITLYQIQVLVFTKSLVNGWLTVYPTRPLVANKTKSKRSRSQNGREVKAHRSI